MVAKTIKIDTKIFFLQFPLPLKLIKSKPHLTCALQWHSPPRCPGPSWRRWDTSCTPSGLGLRHRPRSKKKHRHEWATTHDGTVEHGDRTDKIAVKSILGLLGWYHIGLPALRVDTAIDAPPEVILWLTLPCKHRYPCRKQSTPNGEDRQQRRTGLAICLSNRPIRAALHSESTSTDWLLYTLH